jgi:hypothetical protein
MKLYNGQAVVIDRDDYGIPKDSAGTIVRQDYGDTDFRTYTVKFGDKVVIEVREYHLKGG